MVLNAANHCSIIMRVALLLCIASLHGCLLEDDILQPFRSLEPAQLDDGWEVSTSGAEGFDADALEGVFRDLHGGDLWQLRSVLVFRNGKLVAESYQKDDADRMTQRAIWSCTKQFVGVLTGMAIERGLIAGLDEPLADCLEEIGEDHPNKSDITIEDLLQMRSGIAFSNDGAEGQTSQMLRELPSDSADFILGLPMNETPGEVSAYNDGNPHLLSLCIQRRVGVPLDEWADEVLLSTIGMDNYRWRRYRDGSTLGAFGILTTPRQFAKLAQLVLDDGMWEGEQVVSREWIAEMTAPRVDSYDDRYRFGYLWWHHTRLDVSFMNGHGGQYAFIDRATSTIVAITSEPNTQGDFQLREHQGAAILESVLATIER